MLALAAGPRQASAQDDIDFVFRDEDGHLILRFVGVPPGGLSTTQRDDVENSEFSTMVHDHLRADLRFEAEPPDAAWSSGMVPQIESWLRDRLEGFASTTIECRAASCRIVLEHTARLPMTEHEAMLGQVQSVIQDFVDTRPGDFQRSFTITAYEQQFFMPHIKAFISRAVRPAGRAERPTTD
jgi:hypothetical protein